MDEKNNIWNKKMSDLTVKDQLVLSVAIPAVMVGGAVAVGAVVGAASDLSSKVRARFNKPKTDIEVK